MSSGYDRIAATSLECNSQGPQSLEKSAHVLQLETALRESQFQVEQLKAALEETKKELANIKADGSTQSSRRRKLGAQVPAAFEDTVRTLGKSFAVTVDPWIEPGAFSHFPPTLPNINLDPDAEYQDFDAYKGKAGTRLYQHLKDDEKLVDMASRLSGFASAFTSHLNNQRSIALNKLRTELPAILARHGYSADPNLFAADAGKERASSDLVASMLTFDKKEPYPLFSPFMYRKFEKESKNLFLNPLGPEVLRFTLFAHATTITGSSKTVGVKWGITACTSSSISFALILLYAVFSSDSELAPIGSTSKIPYWQRYFEYKKMLTVYHHMPRVQQIFRFWNSVVFTGVKQANTETGVAVGSKDVEDLEAALLDLAFDEDPDDSPTTGSTGGRRVSVAKKQSKMVTFAEQVQDIQEIAPSENLDPDSFEEPQSEPLHAQGVVTAQQPDGSKGKKGLRKGKNTEDTNMARNRRPARRK